MTRPNIVYLNHAGTSWPKPPPVVSALESFGGTDPTQWPDLFRSAHQFIADFFGVQRSRMLLTPSCTAALGIAVADHPWRSGDRILTSRYEHHALQRPLVKLQEHGVNVIEIPAGSDELLDLEQLEKELQSGQVRLVALTAACNVTGQLLPIRQAINLAHQHGTLVLIDGAQIAGWWPLDLTELGADLFAFAGHKGPQAPWGIGGLYVAPHVSMNSPLAQCEITPSSNGMPCVTMPGYCDAGSVNLASMAGMAAALDWLAGTGQSNRLAMARGLAVEFADSIRHLPSLSIHGDIAADQKMPTVAITIGDKDSSDVSRDLQKRGLVVSGGFQCARRAHQSLGTSRTGVLRFSFGPCSQPSDVEPAVNLLTEIVG